MLLLKFPLVLYLRHQPSSDPSVCKGTSRIISHMCPKQGINLVNEGCTGGGILSKGTQYYPLLSFIDVQSRIGHADMQLQDTIGQIHHVSDT